MNIKLLIVLLFLIPPILFGCSTNRVLKSYESPYYPLERLKKGNILHVPTGTLVSEDDLISYISGSRIVYVGEVHDNIEHHDLELKIIKALERLHPGKVAVGMEMFKIPYQTDLDSWVRGYMDEKTFFKVWTENWTLDYDYYKPILEYLREKRIPLIGLNASRDMIMALKDEEGNHKAKFKLPDIDKDDPYHRAMVKAVLGDPRHSGIEFDDFYKIQLLWEETMAQTIADYLKSDTGKDRYMVVLAGGGHINYGFGIPKRVFRRFPQPYTTILLATDRGELDKKTARSKGIKLLKADLPYVPLYISDFVWATGYETLKGKKPKLGIQYKEKDGKVRVVKVSKGSAAEEAGIKPGDLIVRIDNDPIEKASDLLYHIGLKRFGDEAKITVLRDGKRLNIEVSFHEKED